MRNYIQFDQCWNGTVIWKNIVRIVHLEWNMEQIDQSTISIFSWSLLEMLCKGQLLKTEPSWDGKDSHSAHIALQTLNLRVRSTASSKFHNPCCPAISDLLPHRLLLVCNKPSNQPAASTRFNWVRTKILLVENDEIYFPKFVLRKLSHKTILTECLFKPSDNTTSSTYTSSNHQQDNDDWNSNCKSNGVTKQAC